MALNWASTLLSGLGGAVNNINQQAAVQQNAAQVNYGTPLYNGGLTNGISPQSPSLFSLGSYLPNSQGYNQNSTMSMNSSSMGMVGVLILGVIAFLVLKK